MNCFTFDLVACKHVVNEQTTKNAWIFGKFSVPRMCCSWFIVYLTHIFKKGVDIFKKQKPGFVQNLCVDRLIDNEITPNKNELIMEFSAVIQHFKIHNLFIGFCSL